MSLRENCDELTYNDSIEIICKCKRKQKWKNSNEASSWEVLIYFVWRICKFSTPETRLQWKFYPARPFVFIYTPRPHCTALCCHIESRIRPSYCGFNTSFNGCSQSNMVSPCNNSMMACLQRKKNLLHPPNTIQAPKVRVMNSSNGSFTHTGCQPSPSR